EHLELHRLDCLSSHRDLTCYDFTQRFLADTPPEAVRPARILTGDDLKAMGYAPGPAFKEMLRAVEDAQLEGKIRTHEQAVEMVRDTFLNGGSGILQRRNASRS
ncbi:MAG TPA: hypothetical protein VGR93_13975, partial [Candidatus Acidoferrales bacterium]|nr:hypothetical protein [Candidatus Acidoferrales bacterium]